MELTLICGATLLVGLYGLIRINRMSEQLDALIANEAALEAVVAQVVIDNSSLHAELTAALANTDSAGIRAVADKLAAQNAKLSALVTPAA